VCTIFAKMFGMKTSCFISNLQNATRSHPEMVGDMSRVTLNFDLSKIPFVHFYQGQDLKTCTFTGSHVRAVTDANGDDDMTTNNISVQTIIIDFPNTGITYNGGWCSATIAR